MTWIALPPYRRGVTRRQLGNPWCRSGLPQAEVAENEEHYHYDANNVENAVHVVFSFLARDGITGAPDSITLPRARAHERTGRTEAVRSCLRSLARAAPAHHLRGLVPVNTSLILSAAFPAVSFTFPTT
jgi:hypothetical protein